jgi:hypothetical protein
MKRALSNGLVLFMLSGVAPLMSAPLSEAELNAAIKESIAKGGGEIVLPPGTIAIEKGLRFENAKNLRILGSPGDVTVLKLPQSPTRSRGSRLRWGRIGSWLRSNRGSGPG